MNTRINLTEGNIARKMILLALPIMGTSFIQMAYNMIDMIWVGKIGSKSVAAVGTAGFFPWLAMAFILISKVGAEVKVAQSIGEDNKEETKKYIKSAIELNIVLSILYSLFVLLFRRNLVGIFNLGDIEVIKMAENYLAIIAFGMVFYFINPIFTAIFNGMGNSAIPFRINSIGLIINIILDPILILGLGPIPKLGVEGAAIATIFAQSIVSFIFIIMIIKTKNEYFKVRLYRNINTKYHRTLCSIGIPVAIQSGLFTIFSMSLGVIVASFGPVAIAVKKVGAQIESISWMISEGIASALTSFVGQNYGAKKLDRVEDGSKIAITIAFILGTLNTFVLVFLGEYIFSIFINESDAIIKGTVYLKILGYSQLFMCVEIITAGVFRGLSKTSIPSTISIIFTGARIPLAYILSSPNVLGLNGIWWSITLSSIFKGVILLSIFIALVKSKILYEKHNLKLLFRLSKE